MHPDCLMDIVLPDLLKDIINIKNLINTVWDKANNGTKSNIIQDLMHIWKKVADFQVITYLNLGIDLQDILRYNEKDLRILYNIPKLNENKLTMYKQMIGAI